MKDDLVIGAGVTEELYIGEPGQADVERFQI
jgi:hypothetical protein